MPKLKIQNYPIQVVPDGSTTLGTIRNGTWLATIILPGIGTRYSFTYMDTSVPGTTESAAQRNLGGPLHVYGLACHVNPAPGAGTSWQFSFRVAAGATSPALTCTVSNTATNCSSFLTLPGAPITVDQQVDIHTISTGAVATVSQMECQTFWSLD